MTHKTSLDAKVAARNRVNLIANNFATWARSGLADFVGHKVHKADDSLTKQLSDRIMAGFGYPVGYQRWHHASTYSLCFRFKTWEASIGLDCSITNDQEQYATVGEVRDGVLTRLYTAEEQGMHRIDYTADEIRVAREALHALERRVSEASWFVTQFGRHDN